MFERMYSRHHTAVWCHVFFLKIWTVSDRLQWSLVYMNSTKWIYARYIFVQLCLQSVQPDDNRSSHLPTDPHSVGEAGFSDKVLLIWKMHQNNTNAHIPMHTWRYTHEHLYPCMHAYTYTCIYTQVYTCVCVCTHPHPHNLFCTLHSCEIHTFLYHGNFRN